MVAKDDQVLNASKEEVNVYRNSRSFRRLKSLAAAECRANVRVLAADVCEGRVSPGSLGSSFHEGEQLQPSFQLILQFSWRITVCIETA